MKTILTIGCYHFGVPAKKSINSIRDLLSDCKSVDRRYVNNRIEFVFSESPGVSVDLVEDHLVTARKALPEKASPDSHNTF